MHCRKTGGNKTFRETSAVDGRVWMSVGRKSHVLLIQWLSGKENGEQRGCCLPADNNCAILEDISRLLCAHSLYQRYPYLCSVRRIHRRINRKQKDSMIQLKRDKKKKKKKTIVISLHDIPNNRGGAKKPSTSFWHILLAWISELKKKKTNFVPPPPPPRVFLRQLSPDFVCRERAVCRRSNSWITR